MRAHGHSPSPFDGYRPEYLNSLQAVRGRLHFKAEFLQSVTKKQRNSRLIIDYENSFVHNRLPDFMEQRWRKIVSRL